MFTKLHLSYTAPALLALLMVGAVTPAVADPACILFGMLGGPLPPACTGEQDSETGPAANTTRPAFVSMSDVFSFADGTPIANTSSVLTRSQHGVSFHLSTSGLEPDHAITVWWVIFNESQFCADDEGVCTVDDLANPDVGASLLQGSGTVSDFTGRASLSAKLFTNQGSTGEVLFGPALTNSDAEIHLVVRSHGPVSPLLDNGVLEEALSSFGGGCMVNECADLQFAIHQP